MKLIVKNVFRDKEDHVTVYEPGTILEVNNSERASDLVKRGLCEKYEGKDVAAFTLGKPAAKTSVKGNAAKTAKKETKIRRTAHAARMAAAILPRFLGDVCAP